ncbi:transcriptional regulator [Burkholderia humptydooensis]|uniref:Transcriptional regulator n=3 Tax=Burkholderia humptydooensis TaxID=430531 RepID=A0A7U4P6I8_9BURK|nr:MULTISPECIES: PhaM family polyhydroxyalkanoate granule multifunctional regulatory protein [Burkholderia]AJY42724.1 hypothetical protein BW21_3492 [Burkholderia sp. 2002721687]ALX43894.1 transcriptional regulator [Burkholderia humptydooensis]EIP89752.1 hypothetical protein A33K_13334 [Burkholderia humptydooensis MSMB43]QPS44166.1 transcriptional regulator [Burkholderia humptydooensis]
MTDTNGSNPFSGYGGFQPAGFLDKMWDMMRLAPFGAMSAFPGASQGLPPSLSAMSDLMAPLASVEELDKRITDLRAVEQWLKLNLGMLQSAIQALEVQRATLATLRAFGTLAQTSMAAAEAALSPDDSAQRESAPATKREAYAGEPADARAGSDTGAEAGAAGDAGNETPPSAADAFDPAGWWNLLQSQFDQLARFAMTQPGMAAGGDAHASGAAAAPKPSAAKKPATRRAASPRASGSAADRAPGASSASSAAGAAKPAAAKKPAKRSP